MTARAKISLACAACPRKLLAVWLCTLAVACTTLAGEAPSANLFDEQLATGEFAPALSFAKALEDGAERDARLVQVAEAQAKAGEQAAAFTTLAAVSDDRSRYAALEATHETRTAAAGGNQADFDALMELIKSTVRPQTWDDVGGPGSISPFPNGVYVDAAGELKRVLEPPKASGLATARLAALRTSDNTDSRRASPLRKVSLTRLEKHVQLWLAAGRQPSDEMLHLAGLEKIKYVLVYPNSRDLVLAGPASDWHVDGEGRHVSRATGRPVLHLDDLVVLLRHESEQRGCAFGCSITPTQEGLARTRQFSEQSRGTSLKLSARGAWLKTLREKMGQQSITVDGIDPRTRVARVIVEADYRMKLVGMGLERGTPEVPSYLDLVEAPRPGEAAALDVLRWWFTLKYDAVHATSDRDAFEIRGPGVQVLSENEMLTRLGERVHTGKSDPLNAEFAQRFTRHFAALARKYPVYAELQNVFDLALVAAIVGSHHLADRVDWHMTCFGPGGAYQPALDVAPKSVESVLNHRVIKQKHLVVGVSGGVRVEPASLASEKAVATDGYGKLDAARSNSAPGELEPEAWWWD